MAVQGWELYCDTYMLRWALKQYDAKQCSEEATSHREYCIVRFYCSSCACTDDLTVARLASQAICCISGVAYAADEPRCLAKTCSLTCID